MTRKSHLYYWKGYAKQSTQSMRGEIIAEHLPHARVLLHQQGITVHRIRKKRNFRLRQHISHQQITRLTRQLALLIDGKLPLLDALTTIQKSQTHPFIHALLHDLQTSLKAGCSLTTALKRHPRLFDHFYCQLIHVGEQSGELTTLLNLLVFHRNKTEELKKQIKHSLRYPLLILTVVSLLMILLLLTLVPQFENFYKNFNAPLPWITQVILYISNQLKHQGAYFLGFFLTFVIIFHYIYARHKKLQAYVEKWMFQLPWIGKFITLTLLAQFTQTLAISLKAGLPLLDALNALTMLSSYQVYQQAQLHLKESLTRGISLPMAMQHLSCFPPEAAHRLAVGEASGHLVLALEQLTQEAQETCQDMTKQLNAYLEPGLILSLGLGIAGLVGALYLPILQLGTIIS